jgi:hypothetical protein
MFLLAFLLTTSFASAASTQEDMEAINQLRYQFENNYAPKALKEEVFGWNLKSEIKNLKEVRKSGDFKA